jgi:hypothetical protein
LKYFIQIHTSKKSRDIFINIQKLNLLASNLTGFGLLL